MLRTLFRRNLVLMITVVLAGQVLAGFLVTTLVIRPQVIRFADVTADMLGTIDVAMTGLPANRRAALIMALKSGDRIDVRSTGNPPSDGARAPTLIEHQFLLALARRLPRDSALTWRTDRPGQLWFLVHLGPDRYWISVGAPREGGALVSLSVALIIAFVVATAGGMILQRRIDRPLRQMAHDLDDYHADGTAQPLAVHGPIEIAAIADALNRMTARIAEQGAERAVMLAGVSHDLRTPLTRLRLCLDMMAGTDSELDATAERQVTQIETMLGQFLSFANGFADEPIQPTDVAGLARAALTDAGLGESALSVPADLIHPLRPHAIGRALANLIGNAQRHGQAPITVRITHDGAALRMAVHDAGAGFDPALGAAMLVPFARGDSARSGDGTGLGLAIAQRAAAAQGGHLEFRRDVDGFVAQLVLPD